MNVEFKDDGNLHFDVPLTLGITMMSAAFESELKSARIFSRTCCLRRRTLQNTRNAASLLIQLNGREVALPHLRDIARRVAREVEQ
jgi:hypothetical protein